MIYAVAKRKLLTTGLTEGLSVMLLGDGYVFDASHETTADVEDAEFSSSGYSRQTLEGVQVIETGTAFAIDADDPAWPEMTGVVGGAVFFAPGFLVSYHGFQEVLDGDQFIVSLAENGLLGVSR